jgi:hypothetical protein
MKVFFVHEENVLLRPSEVPTWFGMGSFRENLPHGSHGSGHDGTSVHVHYVLLDMNMQK